MERTVYDVITGNSLVIPLTKDEIALAEANALEQAATQKTPQEVTRFQARGALYQAGLLDKVEAFIAAEGADMMLKLAWQDAQTFKRYSPFITGVGQLLGLSDKQLDALFVAANLIE